MKLKIIIMFFILSLFLSPTIRGDWETDKMALPEGSILNQIFTNFDGSNSYTVKLPDGTYCWFWPQLENPYGKILRPMILVQDAKIQLETRNEIGLIEGWILTIMEYLGIISKPTE